MCFSLIFVIAIQLHILTIFVASYIAVYSGIDPEMAWLADWYIQLRDFKLGLS